MARLEFWFDFSCPYAYLASTQVEAVAARTGAILDSRPFLLGGVFRAHKTPQVLFSVLSEQKKTHNAADLERYARFLNAPYQMPSGHPFRTVTALRSLLVVGGDIMPLVHAYYAAYWVRGEDLSDEAVLTKILTERGHDAQEVLQKTKTQTVKDDLRARTDEAIRHGIFGAPAFRVKDELYWGQDRLDLVEAALGGTPPRLQLSGEIAPVELWYDYSSPFAYLGVMQAHRLFGSKIHYRPMLLGGLFKSIGTSNVPYFEQNDAKKAHTQADLHRQAKARGIEFSWPTSFPVNSVRALRVTLAAERLLGDAQDERIFALREAIFGAYWAEQKDIADVEVLRGLVTDLGLDADTLIEATQDPGIKASLKDATDAAVAAGVFGAPTFLVQRPQGGPGLYWGSDRLEMAARAAMGDERLR